METVFLSYTYRAHPDHEASLETLRRYVVRTIEAMGLHVVDGVDVGGRPLDDALRKRIAESDALIALVTPQADDAGNIIKPEFVLSEFQYAEGKEKPTMRVWHHQLVAQGLGAGNEYAAYKPGNELPVVLKLMNTIALWYREQGRRTRVRIEPEHLAQQFDPNQGHNCQCLVISSDGSPPRDFEKVNVSLDPGAIYALPKIREGQRVRLRVCKGNKTWESKYATDPFIGGINLEERE
jgi:hypothetical protein